MNKLLLAVALWVGLVGAAWARTVEEQLLATLRSQGYEILEQGYTFLGRLRVVAQNDELRREIVINPGTGEILRDYAVMLPMIASTTHSDGSAGSARGGGTAGAGAGVSTTLGVAGVSVAGGDPAMATDPDSTVTDTSQAQDGTDQDRLVLPEVIVVVPIMQSPAEGQ